MIKDFFDNYSFIFILFLGFFSIIICIYSIINDFKPMKVEENTVVEYNEKFNLIEKFGPSEYIVYDEDTNVVYYIYQHNHSCGITPLYNQDGSIQVYEGGK